MRSIEELTQLAIDVLTNKIFLARHEEEARNAFGVVLMLLSEDAREQITQENPQAFYEYLDKAGPRSVNGYPSFFSFQWISAEEWLLFCDIYEQKRAALFGDVTAQKEEPHD